PVVPMTIVNSASIFEDHIPKMKKADVIIEFHKPILIGELDKATKKNIGSYISGLIQERYFILRKEYDL
ncbi:MAG: 1-acyl-sn-glycerol-3-phosphate acyltransferase, partial [Blautia sp.]|nr:1-acyl-sn-glycerol-3-phosphate acyltransferase [Blautia sp.]